MTIARMATIITKRRRYMRPLTDADTEALVTKLIPIIAPIDYKIAMLPMTDLFADPYPERWN